MSCAAREGGTAAISLKISPVVAACAPVVGFPPSVIRTGLLDYVDVRPICGADPLDLNLRSILPHQFLIGSAGIISRTPNT